jgi:hypothetical protein
MKAVAAGNDFRHHTQAGRKKLSSLLGRKKVVPAKLLSFLLHATIL